MAETTIAWCLKRRPDGSIIPGYTFNAWEGCSKISPACDHCYADARDHRLHQGKHWGKDAPRFFHTDSYWRQPLKWNKEAREMGEYRFVFCYSLADWLEDHPAVIRTRLRFFQMVSQCDHLIFLMLTKRPQNFVPVMTATADAAKGEKIEDVWAGLTLITHWLSGNPVANIWPGATVESQEYCWRIDRLADIPAPVRFLSCEPLLGELDLTLNSPRQKMLRWVNPMLNMVDWVLAGGESGPLARPSHIKWFRKLRDDCEHHQTAFHYKQHGAYLHESQIWQDARQPLEAANVLHPAADATVVKAKDIYSIAHQWPDDRSMSYKVGAKIAGRQLDGRYHDDYPALAEAA